MPWKLFCVALVCASVIGCSEVRPDAESALVEKEHEQVLTILVDMSGSFAQLMADDGKAYAFATQVVDRYFRDRIGTQDLIIICQLSATDRPLLWQGSPRQLREDFPDAEAFRRLLRSKADENGSRIHLGLAESLEYVMSDPRVANKQAKSAMFVLSDMIDNFPRTDEVKKRLLADLAQYARCDGTFGLYYVDQTLVAGWRQYLGQSGIKHWCVESEIVTQPDLPSFE